MQQKQLIIFPTTGQSGAGKGTLIGLLQQVCGENGLTIKVDSLGDRLRELVKKETEQWPENLCPHSDELRMLASNGSKQPFTIIEKLLEYILAEAEAAKVDVLIVDGSPRDAKECVFWRKQTKYTIHGIIIDAPYEMCFKRLWNRTIEDKRIELSVDGQPGVPDAIKIKNKLSWFNRDTIAGEMVNRIPFSDVMNIGKKEDLLQIARDLFKKIRP